MKRYDMFLFISRLSYDKIYKNIYFCFLNAKYLRCAVLLWKKNAPGDTNRQYPIDRRIYVCTNLEAVHTPPDSGIL